MSKKIIIVTGASDGIGKETAMTLAKQDHTVIIHDRNKQKTQVVYEEIKRETGNQNVDMFLADFLSLAEVKRFADVIKKKYDKLDVLINNAGAQFTEKRETTTEGHEKDDNKCLRTTTADDPAVRSTEEERFSAGGYGVVCITRNGR